MLNKFLVTIKDTRVMVKIKTNEVSEILKDMLELLTDEQKERIMDSFTLQEFKKHEVVYLEGESPTHLLCPIRGKIKIHKAGVGGRSQIIRMIKPKEFFGYRAYFANETFVTDAAACESSVICMIPMTTIESLIKENNDVAVFFIKRLSVDLGISDERTVNLTQKHIRGRLAESLIFLRENYGLEEDGYTLSIYLSREDLASLSNMTASNATRTLTLFAKERIIAIDGKKIKILDEDRLRKISRVG